MRKNAKKSNRRKVRKTPKQKKYEILLVIAIICLLINTHNFYKGDKERKNKSIETSIEPVTDNTTNNNKQKPINSNTTDWNLILVNKENPIPEGYKVQTIKIEEKWEVDTRIREAIEEMLKDARKQGLDPIICSSYRTTEYQKNLFNNKVAEYRKKGYSQKNAEEQAALWVTIPGTSEHELGLSLDIVDRKYQILDENQENTAVQKWLIEHCHEYGFILRYPTDKKDITKINYEPWHYRYVGKEDAKFIKEKDFCLEEYIEFLKEYEN